MGISDVWYLDLFGMLWKTSWSWCSFKFCTLHNDGQVERYRVGKDEGTVSIDNATVDADIRIPCACCRLPISLFMHCMLCNCCINNHRLTHSGGDAQQHIYTFRLFYTL